MTDELFLTLASGLEHAATALDVVDDEARQQIASLLSPKARQLLAALTAADHPSPPPTAVTAPPIAVAPPSASALPPTSDPAGERPTARPRPASGLQAFPEDVLGAIVSFVDLPMRFTCVVACRALRDAAAKLSPRLEHALVLRRYPMLATTGSSPTDATAPRDLLRTYKRYFRSTRRFAQTQPTTTLDEYTLSLEIDVTHSLPQPEGAPQRFRRRSLWIGTGTLSGGNSPAFEFTVPAGLFEIVDDYVESGWDLRANVMASRRIGGRVQVAKLFQGGVADWDETSIMFEWENIPHNRRNKALGWLQRVHDSEDLYMDPQLALYWDAEAGKVDARFVFSTEHDREDMALSDACMTLEHFAEWSK